MKLPGILAPRYAPVLLAMLLPAILVFSSIRTFRELDQMRSMYLRNRTASIASQLENLTGTNQEDLRRFAENEPGLIDVRVFVRPGDPSLADLWNGRELFRTQTVTENSTRIFRALVPFHGDGQLRIAQIDLDAESADFLLVHARHNVIVASVSGGVMVLLAVYALWALRRSAAEEKRNLELAHLAHLGKMSAVLAHEIRTPLATIKGFTQLALEQAGSSVGSLLEPVLDEARRLERLVSDLLLYSRPPAPLMRDCAWDDIARSMLTITPKARLANAPIQFRTDPDLLRHVLANLVRNATEATAGVADAFVDVWASAPDSTVLIVVEDNGPGIPEGEQDRVFESFYTTKSFGTGLGLPIAKSLTAALGGELLLRPREGGGTRAELRLPLEVKV